MKNDFMEGADFVLRALRQIHAINEYHVTKVRALAEKECQPKATVHQLQSEETMSRDDKSSYYDHGGIEVLDVIKAKLTPEQYEGYLLGNAIKYSLRLNHKGCKERDAEKLANYSRWFSEVVSDKTEEFDCIARRTIVHQLAPGELE